MSIAYLDPGNIAGDLNAGVKGDYRFDMDTTLGNCAWPVLSDTGSADRSCHIAQPRQTVCGTVLHVHTICTMDYGRAGHHWIGHIGGSRISHSFSHSFWPGTVDWRTYHDT